MSGLKTGWDNTHTKDSGRRAGGGRFDPWGMKPGEMVARAVVVLVGVVGVAALVAGGGR